MVWNVLFSAQTEYQLLPTTSFSLNKLCCLLKPAANFYSTAGSTKYVSASFSVLCTNKKKSQHARAEDINDNNCIRPRCLENLPFVSFLIKSDSLSPHSWRPVWALNQQTAPSSHRSLVLFPGTSVEKPCVRDQEQGTCVPCDHGLTYTEHSNGMNRCLPCTHCRPGNETLSRRCWTKRVVF